MNADDQALLDIYNDADLYDAEFAERRHEIPFYQHYCRPNHHILELACGTGRLTIPLAQTNATVTGLDLVPTMLKKAQQNITAAGLNGSIQLHLGDMRTPHHSLQNQRYDLIILATNCAQHLLHSHQLQQCLQNSASLLKPNGKIILDIQNPNIQKLQGNNTPNVMKRFQWQGKTITVTHTSAYNPLSQCLHFTLNYQQDKQHLRQKHITIRMYFPQEAQGLISHSGLHIQQQYGDHQQRALGGTSPQQIYVLGLKKRS